MKTTLLLLLIFNFQLSIINSIDGLEDHRTFWGTTLPIDDPFWEEHCPGDRWNCKCYLRNTDKEATDRPTSDNPYDLRHDGLEGNPAHTGEIFTDNCAYVKHAGKNRKERDMVEMKCRALERKTLQDNAKSNPILEEIVQMKIEDKMQNVEFTEWGIKETAQSIFNDKSFWIKNEVLNNCRLLNNTEYIRNARVDLSHNTGKTLRRKRQFALFHYLYITIGNKKFCAHIAELHDGRFVLYTITKNPPTYE